MASSEHESTSGGRPPVEHPPADPAAMEPDEWDVDRRSVLLPEESSVGSADPQAQAEVILEESEARTHIPNAAPDTHLERRGPEERL